MKALMGLKTYDIFRRDSSGPVWLEARLNVENAQALVQNLAAQNPRECFFVFDAQIASVIFEIKSGDTVQEGKA
jgi:hypothetical protein